MGKAWVKNVRNLYLQGVQTCAQIFTAQLTTYHLPLTKRGYPHRFTHFLNSFSPDSYTALFMKRPLIYSHLYTVSTPLTIMETKEKMERNS